ncbi:aldo/keto reductase [Cryobacterium sp. TMS1-20-1]|uniref:aldo/keto reductase n=1 Tax=unclassified Cryobacterium TaxID=2649013 RepID=UPI00106AB294|nr:MULTISPECIES: aldo/keto reductase [unclassified Cryobacterium]TFC74020.1 aldo/keto reductase [Cryobacterium sp. TMS1-20-1]TFD53804.1 aldo/keto reductase [Cryobacterium sp. Hh11]
MTEFTPGRLGYGAANVGNLYRAITDAEASLILGAAWDAGIRHFDTAPHYGLGLSERRLGAFLATKSRDEFTVSTKVGRLLRPNPEGAGRLDLDNDFAVPAELKRVWDFSPDGIRSSLDESLERTGLDRFDVVYLHDPERNDLQDGLDRAIPALVGLRAAGLVRRIGVGSMATAALLACVQTGALDLIMIAGRYTLADQSALAEVVPACRHYGVGIVNASVFNSGLLATDRPGSDARYDYADVPVELLARVQRIAAVCQDFGVSLPAAALQYSLRDNMVRCVVVGGSSPHQLAQNAQRMAEVIPSELWQRLTEQNLIPA